MGWETRKRGTRYYTRSVRVNGAVRREYVGTGILAECVFTLDRAAQEARAAEALRRRAEREELRGIGFLMGEVDNAADTILKAHLLAGGYHRHNKGEWRKRRA